MVLTREGGLGAPLGHDEEVGLIREGRWNGLGLFRSRKIEVERHKLIVKPELFKFAL